MCDVIHAWRMVCVGSCRSLTFSGADSRPSGAPPSPGEAPRAAPPTPCAPTSGSADAAGGSADPRGPAPRRPHGGHNFSETSRSRPSLGGVVVSSTSFLVPPPFCVRLRARQDIIGSEGFQGTASCASAPEGSPPIRVRRRGYGPHRRPDVCVCVVATPRVGRGGGVFLSRVMAWPRSPWVRSRTSATFAPRLWLI